MIPDPTVLVNPSHPVPEGFQETLELVDIAADPEGSVLMEAEAARAFGELRLYLGKLGLPALPLSGFRTTERQQLIWDQTMQDKGPDYTARYVARPGYSEHQTGLALDVVLCDPQGLPVDDNDAPEYDVMFPHLHKFGFILRYPRGREAVTGYAYEPWHIRYVGTAAAKAIHDNGWTLEEYKEKENRP